MRTRSVMHFYCDFCKRVTHTLASMTRHESTCLRNPERVCGMCMKDEGREQDQSPITALMLAAEDGIKSLRECAHHCPTCMLAAIIQRRYWIEKGLKWGPKTYYTNRLDASEYDGYSWLPIDDELSGWDYKAEAREWWSEFHAIENEGRY